MTHEADSVLAIDIGGTKIAAAVVDSGARVMWREDLETPRGSGAEVLFDEVCELAERVRSRHETAPVLCGVGCGGPMVDGLVSPLNISDWRGFPLRARLTARLGVPVAVDNDAKALALAEGWRGAARHARDYLAMVVSTGVGGGLVVDGRLLDGRLGNAGHVGHVIVEPDGAKCECGARGCLEAEASGTAIRARTGRPAAQAGPEERGRAGRLVGRAIASMANALDLDLAVVGGSVALGFGEEFFSAAQAELSERARLAFSAGCRVLPAGLGADGPLVGAAAVAFRAAGRDWIAQ